MSQKQGTELANDNEGFSTTADDGAEASSVVIEMQAEKNEEKNDEKSSPGNDEEETYSIGLFQVFKFSSAFDKFLIFVGVLCSLAHGTIMPLLVYILGFMIDDAVHYERFSCSDSDNKTSNGTDKAFMDERGEAFTMDKLAILCSIIGACSFVLCFFQSYCWAVSAEKQSDTIRKAYFRSLLGQNIGWYDKQEVGSLTSKFADDINTIHKGIGDKLGLFISSFGSFLGCIVVAFKMGWKLALATCVLMPVNVIATYLTFKVAFSRYDAESDAYSQAGAIAQEVLSSIRTVTAFGRQTEEVKRYSAHLSKAKDTASRSGLYTGVLFGGTWFFLICMYAIGFAYGANLIYNKDDGYSIGVCLTIVFALIEGTFAFGQGLEGIQNFAASKAAAENIYKIIDRKPEIDTYSESGQKCDVDLFSGRISFENVEFAYPSRDDVQIFHGLSLNVEPGSTVALVGPSGCGKSTVFQLLQRFYNQRSGKISISGVEIGDYNVASIRSLIGSVSQEPVLFATTISENIRFGIPDKELSQADIERVSKLANCHDFISKLPKGYETVVGEQGGQLSGGQKQRIAIARALARNPRILLLDEATSALDTESEAIVQDALDRACQGRTTMVIAHRLSTIMNADLIYVIDKGRVCEQGKHAELISQNGIYAKLVEAQQGSGNDTETSGKDHRAALVEKNKDLALEEHKLEESKFEFSISELKEEEEKLVKANFSFVRLWKMAKTEWPYYLLGSIGAIIAGLVWPSYAIVLSRILAGYSECDTQKQYDQAIFYSMLMFVIGAGSFIGYTLLFWMFAYGGERLVLRVRRLVFETMLRQEIAWFDKEDNSPGALTTRLSTQAAALKDATGGRAGQIVQIVAGVIACLVIAFLNHPIVTLVALAFAPLGMLSLFATGYMFSDSAAQDKNLEKAGKVLAQSTTNIRTVTALGLQDTFIYKFSIPIQERYKQQFMKLLLVAASFACLESSFLFAFAAAFYVNSELEDPALHRSFEQMFTALIAIMWSSYFIGTANAMAPDQAQARQGVAQIFKLLDETPEIKWDNQEIGYQPAELKGDVSLNHVEFSYPSRNSVKVLNGLTLNVESGQTVALVGPSGCGKSTVVQLAERFYDPSAGEVKLDDHALPMLSLSWIRASMALVSQEPVLFDRTIAENIAYGSLDGDTLEIDDSDVEKVAKMANIHNFIADLPDGYKTRVGERGGQLSGGQKQRIAIARALIRRPKLLLLDEATSALDSESEKIVQAAIDDAREGRTAVIIAHRLSTIENADVIAVIEKGIVKELGKHNDLLAAKGSYYSLWSAQSLTPTD